MVPTCAAPSKEHLRTMGDVDAGIRRLIEKMSEI